MVSAIAFIFSPKKTFHHSVGKPVSLIRFLSFLFIQVHPEGCHQRLFLFLQIGDCAVYAKGILDPRPRICHFSSVPVKWMFWIPKMLFYSVQLQKFQHHVIGPWHGKIFRACKKRSKKFAPQNRITGSQSNKIVHPIFCSFRSDQEWQEMFVSTEPTSNAKTQKFAKCFNKLRHKYYVGLKLVGWLDWSWQLVDSWMNGTFRN